MFALAAVVPIVPYILILLVRGVPRFDLVGDLAWMEYDTRHVWRGDTLVGLSSRFGWAHPGPFFFWIAAPFEKLFGAAGLFVATALLSGAAAATAVGVTRALAGRVHAMAVLLVLAGWFGAFGNVAVDPWVRTVVVLPLLACLILAVFVAKGEAGVAVGAAFFAAMAGQTHVSTVPTLGVVGAVSLVGFFVARRRGLSKRSALHLALAVLLLVVSLVPPIVEQRRAAPGEGNLARLVTFFAHRSEPYKPLGVGLRDWAMVVGWIPDRLTSWGIARDGAIPFAMRWDDVPPSASRLQLAVAVAHVLAMAIAAVVAFQRRDRVSLGFLTFALLGDALAVSAIRAIVGEVHYSLLFSATPAVCLGWIGIFSALGGAIVERVALHRWTAQAMASVSIVCATTLQCIWLVRFPFAPASYPTDDASRSRIYSTLREQSRRDGLTPTIHLDGAWPVAVSMILEYDRDAAGVYIGERERWGFPGGRSATGVPNVRHIWFGDPWNPVPAALTPCMQILATDENLTVFTSLSDVVRCER